MDYHEKSPQEFVGSLLFYTLLLDNYYLYLDIKLQLW